MINCLFEAALQKIMTNCSCLHTSSHYKPKNISYCGGKKLECAIDWMSHLGSSIDPALTIANDTSGHPLKCLQLCDFQTEIVSATASTFPNIQTFFFRPEFCYVLQKISIICTKSFHRKVFESQYPINNICSEVLEMNNTLKTCDTNESLFLGFLRGL